MILSNDFEIYSLLVHLYSAGNLVNGRDISSGMFN